MSRRGRVQLMALSLREGEEHRLTFGGEAPERGLSVDYRLDGDILLHVKAHPERKAFILNDYVDGQWRTPSVIPFEDEPGPRRIALSFDRDGISACLPGGTPTLFRTRSLIGLSIEATVPHPIEMEPRGPAAPGEDAPPAGPEATLLAESLRAGEAAPPAPAPGQPPAPEAGVPAPEEAPPARSALGQPATPIGYVDFYAELSQGAWVVCGWSRERWAPEAGAGIVLHFEDGEATTGTHAVWYDRPDLGGAGIGYLMVLKEEVEPLRRAATLVGLSLGGDRETAYLVASAGMARPTSLQASQWVGDIMGRVLDGEEAAVREIVTRPVYTGIDTLSGLPVPFHFEADEVIAAGEEGFFVLGWMLDPQNALAGLRLRAGRARSPDLRERWLPVERADVRDAFAGRYDLPDARCGFLALGPIDAADARGLHVEVTLRSGEVAFKPLPPPSRTGVSAIRRVLGGVRLTRDEIQRAFDEVLGPPLVQLNRARLARPLPVSEIRFGEPCAAPRCSIVVPLYGRMDFIEYQCALFSETRLPQDELLYVLDEPAKKAGLLELAQVVHAKFGVPLRILLPAENRGFGPASNLGLQMARGRYVCFLNSDVFPRHAGWLDRLVESLESDPAIGIAGSLLLFADGSVQHAGLDYEPLPQFAGWPFPMHPGKGLRPAGGGPRLVDVPGVTGACMLLRKDLADELGGFDPDYVIGDFEDADLCHRIRARGLRSVVDRESVLYHLERQSQGDQAQNWRMYLTLLNAWTHSQRWQGVIGAGAVPEPATGGAR